MFGDGAESVSRRYVPAPGRDRPARSVRLAGMLAQRMHSGRTMDGEMDMKEPSCRGHQSTPVCLNGGNGRRLRSSSSQGPPILAHGIADWPGSYQIGACRTATALRISDALGVVAEWLKAPVC